jgi:hypothetical protein
MQAAEKRLDPAISPQTTPLSEASAQDRQFYVSYGMIISTRLNDVQKIREAIQDLGGKIAFQTVTSAPLFLLREYQVKKALSGDLSELAEIYAKKKERRLKE